MKTKIKIAVWALLVTLTGVLILGGCSNTWKGVGKDIEKTGEAIQKE